MIIMFLIIMRILLALDEGKEQRMDEETYRMISRGEREKEGREEKAKRWEAKKGGQIYIMNIRIHVHHTEQHNPSSD